MSNYFNENACIKLCYILLLIVISVGCTNKLNKKNFNRIALNTTFDDVIAILGEPTYSSTLSLGYTTGTNANWNNHKDIISIQFFNGRVKSKRFEPISIVSKGW
jgi:hypothetical protein